VHPPPVSEHMVVYADKLFAILFSKLFYEHVKKNPNVLE
jgi:hypothetical protein